MKTKQIIGNSIGTFLVIIFLLFSALNFFSAPDSKGLFGFKGYTVVSGSMEPTFSTGDYVVDKVKSFDQVKKGDIITFKSDDTIVTHRVKKVTAKGVTTQGDANNIQDQAEVSADEYIGHYLFVIPKLGIVVELLQQPVIFASVIGLMAILLIFLYLNSSGDNGKHTEKEVKQKKIRQKKH